MTIRDILSHKGREVVTASPRQTILEALRSMVEHNIGALVVVDGQSVSGIFTERDALRLAARRADALDATPVEEVMTRDLVIGVESDSVDYVMEVMTNNRVRHLPIMEDGQLRGIVSIGDVVNACRKEVEAENRYLKDYIHGVVR